jgi:hypothetical protein
VEFLKKFHVINPNRRYIGKFGISNLKRVEKTKNNTPSNKRGSIRLQIIPKTELL